MTAEFWRKTMLASVDVDVSANTSNVASCLDVASSARVPIKYSCKKGDCATCEVNFNGKIVKACQASLPSKGGGKVVIGVPVK